ncbi:MAG: rhodanese-like domain-containing protein [Pseudomonadota bacterium]|nr:rhodanese-like domain-containing protein [Pseudomonadota bacterium]
MIRTRFVLASSMVLAIAACAPSDGEDDGAGSVPSYRPGYELASLAGAPAVERPGATIREIDANTLKADLQSGGIRLIDVRTPEEFDRGHIEGAELIPVDSFDPSELDLTDGRKVILYCRSGRRSATAARRLATHTGAPSTHLSGGIKAWEAAGLPIRTP